MTPREKTATTTNKKRAKRHSDRHRDKGFYIISV